MKTDPLSDVMPFGMPKSLNTNNTKSLAILGAVISLVVMIYRASFVNLSTITRTESYTLPRNLDSGNPVIKSSVISS